MCCWLVPVVCRVACCCCLVVDGVWCCRCCSLFVDVFVAVVVCWCLLSVVRCLSLLVLVVGCL